MILIIETILNKCYKFKRFVYKKSRIAQIGKKQYIAVNIIARKNTQGFCSSSIRNGPTYDHQKRRKFRFVPLCGIPVIFCYSSRRIDCRCGVKIEYMSWTKANSHLTNVFKIFCQHGRRGCPGKRRGWFTQYRRIKRFSKICRIIWSYEAQFRGGKKSGNRWNTGEKCRVKPKAPIKIGGE